MEITNMRLYKIPFFSLHKQIQEEHIAIFEKIKKVICNQCFIGGQPIIDFEKKLALITQSQYALACNSGTDAIFLALQALNIKQDELVVTTPFSFISSSSEIVSHGAVPVFIDVDPFTFNLCPKQLLEWLIKNTKREKNITIHRASKKIVRGILAVNMFGLCADWNAINTIAKEWNLWTIEDSCQSIGAQTLEGKISGNLADVSCFSFYPTKNIGAWGDAGACTTNNSFLAEKIHRLRNHGRKSHYNYEELGINSRMDAIQATVLCHKLQNLPLFNNNRKKIAQLYFQELGTIKGIKIPQKNNKHHVYHQYSILFEDEETRNKLKEYLEKRGIETRIFYPQLLSDIPFLKKNSIVEQSLSVANAIV
jgi:dTDP-4-amino-4,6-dideoxygalactose transaminase